MEYFLLLRQERVNALSAQLETLNPQATLSRGYAIVRKDQTVITQTGQVSQGDDLLIQVSDGEFGATVQSVESK